MIRVAIFLVILLTSSIASFTQEVIKISYLKPYKFKEANQQMLVRSSINSKELSEGFSIFLNENQIDYQKTDSGTIELFLPLVGKTSELKFYTAKKRLFAKQLFKPLVSADWGYFGKGTIHIICSSHQDIAWMSTPDSCRHERVHDIIIPALDQIDKNPDFRFEMEQTLNLMEVLEDSPEQKDRIIEAYKNGQFSWGATYTQPYEGLESGEQLIRQSYLGRKWIKDNLPGMDAHVAYNIDVPGRSIQFPQILEKSGIPYLFVSRMKEGFFNWYSPNGSKVLTYSPGNYGWALLKYKYFEDDVITAFQKMNKVVQNWDDYYIKRNIPPHYGVVISTDAGGPKDYTPIINEWNKIVEKSGSDLPLLRHSTAEDFFAAIDVEGTKFDSISGERPNLWLYIHGPGHYQAIKAKKSAAVSLPAAEIFSSVIGLKEKNLNDYQQEKIEEGWSKAIYPDHGWGGKHGEITDSIFRATLEESNSIGERVLNEALVSLSSNIKLKKSNSIVVFNDLSWERNGVVKVDISGMKGNEWLVHDANGNVVPSQIEKLIDKKIISFAVEGVPSIGYKTFYLKKGKSNLGSDVETGLNFYENKFYLVEFGQGGITKLFDKEIGKNIFNTTKFAGGDVLSLGYSGNGAGEFVQITEPNMVNYETLGMNEASWKLKAVGSVYASYEASYKMRNFTVIQTVRIYHHVKKIDFDLEVPDWTGEHNRQLRVAFPLNMEAAQVTYDVPNGIVNVNQDELKISPRGWSWGGTYRQMSNEIHPREIENFITASNEDFGVTVSTDLSVADWIDPTRESVDYPVLQGILLSTHKSCHGEGNWYHQTGGHKFSLSITSHKSGWKNGYHFGVEGNHGFSHKLKQKSQNGDLPEEKSFLSVSCPFVKVSTLKKADEENTLVLRLVEMEGVDKEVDIELFEPVKELLKTNLIEETEKDKPTGQNGNSLKFKINKNAIDTYKLKL